MSLTINSGNDLSTLFSSLNNKSNDSTSGLASILSEYNSIRNGSYLKLAKQYYAKDTTGKNSVLKDEFKDKSSMINDDTKITENKSLISDVSKFRKSLSTVKSDDTLFEKKAYKDENGNEKMDYDYDKIYDRLSSFATAYNAVVEAGAESDSSTVLRNTLSMTNAVNASKKTLTAVGFTVNTDNTLSISKESLMKGDMNSAKYLFASTSNFARQLDVASTNVASQAASEVYSLGGYTSTGAYKQTLETIYNTTI